jgi:hypothetical protein
VQKELSRLVGPPAEQERFHESDSEHLVLTAQQIIDKLNLVHSECK